jgi:hypothetical protein
VRPPCSARKMAASARRGRQELEEAAGRPPRRGRPALRGRWPSRLGEATWLCEEDGRPKPHAASPHHDLRRTRQEAAHGGGLGRRRAIDDWAVARGLGRRRHDGGLGQEAHGGATHDLRRTGSARDEGQNEQARRRTGKRIVGRKRTAVEEDWGLG